MITSGSADSAHASDATPIRVERRGAVFGIELNRPDTRNPLDTATVDALSSAVVEASADASVRVILLTAAGKAFSAGGNLGNLAERLRAEAGIDGADPIAQSNRRYGTFLELLSASPKITIAAVQGAAMGGGAGLVCTADISIGAHDSIFGFPETGIGLIPAQILPFVAARIGLQSARRLMLTGERIDAAEAHRIGLLDYRIDDATQWEMRVGAIVDSVLRCAPAASTATKAMLRASFGMDAWHNGGIRKYLDDAAMVFARQMRSEAIEGVAASRGKRAPDWSTSGRLSVKED